MNIKNHSEITVRSLRDASTGQLVKILAHIPLVEYNGIDEIRDALCLTGCRSDKEEP